MTLHDKVALVTGASRGIGKGIALALGEAGATVYITGRTVDPATPTVPLAGTIHETAALVTQSGGQGIAVVCDHREDAQVEAVFEQIRREHGRLDLLVNNAWAGYEGYHNNTYLAPDRPFWEKPLSYWDDNLAGLRWAYAASTCAAKLMTAQGSGAIFNISFRVDQPGNPAYNVAKSATDRLTWEMAHALRSHHIPVISLHPGLVRTEGVMKAAEYFDLSNSQSPQFTGRAILALFSDAKRMEKTGQALNVAQLAQEYDFDDIDGKRPYPE
jgi:dehydrogenase/reductase SDR family member 1